MTRQAAYRAAQLAAGKCSRGCGEPRWENRTTCRTCNRKLRIERSIRYQDEQEDRRMAKGKPTVARVVKGRSPAQIDAAKRFSAHTIGASIPPAQTNPTRSWWVGADRQQLQERVAEEQHRMKSSKYGRSASNPVIGD